MKKIILITLGVLVLVGMVGFWVVRSRQQTNSSLTSTDQSTIQQQSGNTRSKDGPPLLLKHVGIQLAPYDSATQKAGDMVFTKQQLGEFDLPFFDFGYVMPANSAGPSKRNPQPTYIVPLGTKVHAIVDGEVVNVSKLYSNDYTIMIADDKESTYLYEMEHVINPVVKVGDKVKAGDVVAEVSDYDTKNMPGYGLVEIGILKGGTPPTHVCPFHYLDPSIKESVFTNLRSFYSAWNEYRGKTVYNVSAYETPGCLSYEPVEG